MLSWLRGRFGPKTRVAEPAPAAPESDDVMDDLRDRIRRDVAGGYLDEVAILQGALDLVEGDLDPAAVRREAQRVLREALAEHRAAERSWSGATDCDRLDAAFAGLEADGVVSRQNFTCCGTCGTAEIGEEIAHFEESGATARGYAFFHMQDTDSAVDGYGLYLNYGACEDDDSASVAIGHDIVAQLRAHGLQTDWNGDLGKRIGVALDWKRRRTGITD